MGRKKKNAALDEKLARYKADYELDDLNRSNDETSLIHLCKMEIEIEKLFKELAKVDASKDPRSYKDLMTSLRDANNAYNNTQTQLGIARKERTSEADETPLSYIEKLRTHAYTVLDQRLKKLVCPTCNLVLAKYHIYVTEKGEQGAIEFKNKPIDKVHYNVEVECSKCGNIIKENEREETSR